MTKLTKRAKLIKAKVDRTKPYPFDNAIALVKELATAKFNESIDVAVQLGVDAKKSDQVVRGSVVLPAGTGKTMRVAVFATGAKADEAKAAGISWMSLSVITMRYLARATAPRTMSCSITTTKTSPSACARVKSISCWW